MSDEAMGFRLDRTCARLFRRLWHVFLAVILLLFCLNLFFILKLQEKGEKVGRKVSFHSRLGRSADL